MASGEHETKEEKKYPIVCTKIETFPLENPPFSSAVCLEGTGPTKVGNAKLLRSAFFSAQKLKFPNSGDIGLDEGTKLYKKRFWMLFLFCVCSMLNGVQLIQYSIISNIIECYHGVDAFMVNWTSTIFMVMYLVLVLPASWFIGRFDVKVALLSGSFLNLLSTAIQCASLNRDGFPVALASQAVAAVAQVLVLPLPPRLAALWFGAKEVGRATAVGVLGNQFGVAIGFLLPPMVVSNDCNNPPLIKYGRGILAYTLCASNLVHFLLVIATFQTKPPVPPSESSKIIPHLDYKRSLINLATNCNFLKLLLSFGLVTGVCLAVGTLLNQMLAPIYEDSEKTIGWMGITTNLTGFISSFLAGYILDATHKFKETSLAICIAGLMSMGAFTGLLYVRVIWVQFATVLIAGFILNSYFSVGFDFAAEITYPEPEGTTAGILNASSMVFSILIILLSSHLLQMYGIIACCLVFSGAIALACIIAAFTNVDLRRQEKNTRSSVKIDACGK